MSSNKNLGKSSNTPEDESNESDSEGSHKRLPLFIINNTSKSPRTLANYFSGDDAPKSAHPKISIYPVESDDYGPISPNSIEVQPRSKAKTKKGKHSSDKKVRRVVPIEKRKSTEGKTKGKFKEVTRIKSESEDDNSD